jgi:NAD(P)-dependent dehydrogenase (short-subunit alcohol dehydrogenase family)
VYGLDFRDLARLEAFCVHLEQSYDRLDVIINNAAQTVRRPPAYYAHLMEAERTDFFLAAEGSTSSSSSSSPVAAEAKEGEDATARMKQSLRGQHHFNTQSSSGGSGTGRAALGDGAAYSRPQEGRGGAMQQRPGGGGSGLSSAEMTQLALIEGEDKETTSFPTAITDVNGQQVDLRKQNSWTMKLHEVPTVELAEVFAINTIAPTIINARLKNMMLRRPPAEMEEDQSMETGRGWANKGRGKGPAGFESRPEQWRFIVNVSAMEGKFYRYKGDTHPHTNMAKAALNMMTRTSAQDYVKSGIYMTAVDTGWINDEKPIDLAVAHEKTHNFQTPLDEVDAASRVLDPVIAPLRAAQDLLHQQKKRKGDNQGGRSLPPLAIVEPPWGYFLKDYVKTEW